MPEVFSVDKPEEVRSVSETRGWEKVRVRKDSGAVDMVGPKRVAKAFKTKQTVMTKKGIVYFAANGSSIKNDGEKRIVGHAESGEGLSMSISARMRRKFWDKYTK